MMGQECYKLEYIGIVKCNDWYDLDNINQCGWCFDYNEYKDNLYIVWFPDDSLECVFDNIKEYTLLGINGIGEPVQVYREGNLKSIKYLIEHRKQILNSIVDVFERKEVKKYIKALVHAYKCQEELGIEVIR